MMIDFLFFIFEQIICNLQEIVVSYLICIEAGSSLVVVQEYHVCEIVGLVWNNQFCNNCENLLKALISLAVEASCSLNGSTSRC